MSPPRKMTAKKSDVIGFFGGTIKTAQAFGISKGAVSQWPDLIPENRARQLTEVTGGKLNPFPVETSSEAA